MRKLAAMVALVALASMGQAGPATPYHSPSGFSIVPPVGWKVMDPKSTEQLHDIVVQQFKAKMGSSNFALAIFDPAGTSFTNNINVVVNPSVPAGDPSDADAEKYAQELQSQLMQSGLQAKTLYAKIVPYCGHDAIEAESLITMGSQTIHDIQVIIAAGGKRFVVTGSTLENTFAGVRPTLVQSISSMKIDGDTGGSGKLPASLIYVLIGALVGIGIGVAIVLLKRT